MDEINDGYLRIAWAVLLQAFRDCAKGDQTAETWLKGPDAQTYCVTLNISYDLVEEWLAGERKTTKRRATKRQETRKKYMKWTTTSKKGKTS